MSEFEFPDDLVAAQRDFLRLDARCDEVAASLPSGRAIAAGEAEISDEQRKQLGDARAERYAAMEQSRVDRRRPACAQADR